VAVVSEFLISAKYGLRHQRPKPLRGTSDRFGSNLPVQGEGRKVWKRRDLAVSARVGEGSESTKADRRDKIARAGSCYALGSQVPHLRFAHPEAAEDFGVVLAELRGDRAHAHARADLHRGSDVGDFTQFRVACALYHAPVLHLRVGKHLRVIVDRAGCRG